MIFTAGCWTRTCCIVESDKNPEAVYDVISHNREENDPVVLFTDHTKQSRFLETVAEHTKISRSPNTLPTVVDTYMDGASVQQRNRFNSVHLKR